MSEIRILPEEVVNKIAAGEVVERPASVVKELLENSLDAGADRIEIRISGSGAAEILVSDNGRGMNRHEILLALERHATSKLENFEEISRVSSLGFRGEALPSIAGVSVMEMVSRPVGELSGWRLLISGGRVRDLSETGAPEGTAVRVRRLFFNTPARRKFLKSPRTEWGHILREVTARALIRPDVAFFLDHDGERTFSLPPAADLAQRIRDLWGKEISAGLVAVSPVAGPIRVSGFISGPEDSLRLRKGLFLLVNGRPVQDRMILAALREAAGPRLPRGVIPMGVLKLEVDPEEVDVNIHPAKREVAFSRPRQVRAAVAAAIAAALGANRPVASWSRDASEKAAPELLLSRSPSARFGSQAELALSSPAPGESAPGRDWEYRLVGQVGSSYLVVEGPEGMILIDQHAAHERILFEQFSRIFREGAQERQALLSPLPLELDPLGSARLAERAEDLAELGIEVEEFGGGAWVVTALPALLTGKEKEALVAETLAEVAEWETKPADPRREIVVQLACKAAVKAGQFAAPSAGLDLVRKLFAAEDPSCCPHGRPTILVYSWNELALKFGRKHT